jgi:hypothetical protein
MGGGQIGIRLHHPSFGGTRRNSSQNVIQSQGGSPQDGQGAVAHLYPTGGSPAGAEAGYRVYGFTRSRGAPLLEWSYRSNYLWDMTVHKDGKVLHIKG